MRETILNLFFDKDENDFNKKEDEQEKQEVQTFCKFLKSVVSIFLIIFLFKIGEALIFPETAFHYGIIHNIIFGIIIIIFSNILIDHYYVKEIIKISPQNIDKELKEKTKYIFISIMLSTILEIHNIVYEFLYIIANKKIFTYSEKYIYYVFAFLMFLMIITGFIIGSKLIDSIFKQMKSLTDETDGII